MSTPTFAELTGMSAEQLRKPASRKMLGEVVDHSSAAIRALIERVDELQQRMADVQQRGIRYRGVYQRADDYQRGDVVTHAGSLWIATDTTRETPGSGAGWQMAIKSGG